MSSTAPRCVRTWHTAMAPWPPAVSAIMAPGASLATVTPFLAPAVTAAHAEAACGTPLEN